MRKTIKLIGAMFTVYGISSLVYGFFTGDKETMIIAFLAMILGELIDMPLRIRSRNPNERD